MSAHNSHPFNVELNSQLASFHSNFNVAYLNARSLFPSIMEIKSVFENSNVHLIAISESWLKKSHTNKSIDISI